VHPETLTKIVAEFDQTLVGRFVGKVFQLTPFSIAVDFGLRQGRYLYLSAEPQRPRTYLIAREVKYLVKQAMSPSQFVQTMCSRLGGGNLVSVTRDASDRIIRFAFSVKDETGESHNRMLAAQLTGRSANLFLLDESGTIMNVLRSGNGPGHRIGERYQPPPTPAHVSSGEQAPIEQGEFSSLSAAADHYYRILEAEERFTTRTKAIRDRLRKEMNKKLKLQKNLQIDLVSHGDPAQHKRMGDLLLANLTNAQRKGDKVKILDYYSEGQPLIEVNVDANTSLPEAAKIYFDRYTKAKRAKEEITSRLGLIEKELAELRQQEKQLEESVATHDTTGSLLSEAQATPAASKGPKQKPAEKLPGVRRYRSSDGYEIIVGRAAHRNDYLTFRVARPNDLWLHAADYPGSHVIVRKPDRTEIPYRTIIEAAELAAKFSQANKDSRVVVHYTSRKFLSKPKGSAPGLVRMSSFRTITVQPKEGVKRI